MNVETFLTQTIAALVTEDSPMAKKIAGRIRTVLLLSPACKITADHVRQAAQLIIIKSKDIPL